MVDIIREVMDELRKESDYNDFLMFLKRLRSWQQTISDENYPFEAFKKKMLMTTCINGGCPQMIYDNDTLEDWMLCGATCMRGYPWCEEHQPKRHAKPDIRRILRETFPVPLLLPFRHVVVAGWFDTLWPMGDQSLSCAMEIMMDQLNEHIATPEASTDPYQLAIVRFYDVYDGSQISWVMRILKDLAKYYSTTELQHPSLCFVVQFITENNVDPRMLRSMIHTTPFEHWPFAAIVLNTNLVHAVWINTRIFESKDDMMLRLAKFYAEGQKFTATVIHLTLHEITHIHWFAPLLSNPNHIMGRNCLGIFVDQNKMDAALPLERDQLQQLMINRKPVTETAKNRPIKVADQTAVSYCGFMAPLINQPVADDHIILGAHHYICTTNAVAPTHSIYRIDGVDLCVQDTIKYYLMEGTDPDWKTDEIPTRFDDV
jgi:hypothetical protein